MLCIKWPQLNTLPCKTRSMLFESEQFQGRLAKPAGWSDHVFRYSEFTGINTEGGDVDSVFVSCKIENCEWYWGLFNLAIFVQVDFNDCTFRGTAFSGSKFVDCNFNNCEFLKDNLGASCSFDDVVWYGCTQNNCKGLDQEFCNKR